MKNEMIKFLEKLVYPVEVIESRLEQKVASIRDTPTAFRIFIKVCCGFVMCLVLNMYLSIVVILMSILAVACSLVSLKNLISKNLTVLSGVVRKLISMFTPLCQKLLSRVRK